MKAYIAAPWFTPEQHSIVEDIKALLTRIEVDFFSPKDANLFKGDNTTAFQVLDGNVSAIKDCDFVLAVTDGKDVGTMFEAGYAYAIDKPILYVWLTRSPGQKFNLMLAASGAVAHDAEDIKSNVACFKQHGFFMIGTFNGEIE